MEKDIFMIENKTKLHHIINVGNGENYRKSVLPFWGLSENMRTYVNNNINVGDVLWFCQYFEKELKVIGMAEYIPKYDIVDEPLIPMNIIEREKQNWDETKISSNEIQIHYREIYDTSSQNIRIKKCWSHQTAEIFIYNSNEDGGDLYKHYGGFKFYGKPL